MKPETRLKHYLECEQILREFFEEVDYCKNHCISQPESRFLFQGNVRAVRELIPGDIGCCMNNTCDYFDGVPKEMQLLLGEGREERFSRIAAIEQHEYGGRKHCDYHSLELGCLMETHKTPVCIGFVCENYFTYLESQLRVAYNPRVTIGILKSILADQFSARVTISFKEKLKGFVTDAKKAKARYGV